jgi:hypothetical protein
LIRERLLRKNLRIPVTWSPLFCGNGYIEAYKINVSANVGLPPFAQFKILCRIIREVDKYTPFPHYWISVDAPGHWYLNELKRFFYHTSNIVAVLQSGKKPREEDFQSRVYSRYETLAYPPTFLTGDLPMRLSIPPGEFRVLQSLARVRLAAAIELSSLSGFTWRNTRSIAQKLSQKGLIRRKKNGKYEAWEITRRGIREVYRSWKTMYNFNTKRVCCEQKFAGWRHRRVSRLWARTLRTSWGSRVQIWESWSEVNLGGIYPVGGIYPDSVAWGNYNGKEVLFWLEVETGKHSHGQIQRKYQYRLNKVKQYARICGLPIIFTILGPPWTIVSIAPHLTDIPGNVALVLHPWMELDNLPYPDFGARRPQFMTGFLDYFQDKRVRRFRIDSESKRWKGSIMKTEFDRK